MDKLSYLKLCFQNLKVLEKTNWYVQVFGIPLPKEAGDLTGLDHLDLVCTHSGLNVVMDEGEKKLVPISDYKKGHPLFTMEDMISVDHTWIGSIEKASEKRLGGLLINAVALYPVVQKKLPYMDTPITESKFESVFAAKMKDDSDYKDPAKDIHVRDYTEAMDRLWFFTGIANLIVMASSYKFISAPPGARQLADKLIEEYKDNLEDPVVVAKIMDELNKLNREVLKDDPVAKRMMDKKADTARKKLFLMYGETNDFVTSLQSKPILNTMQQGLDTSEEVLPRYMNDLRYASYSRGHSTQLSGYSYKVLQRSLSGLEVTDTPCNTKTGLTRLVSKPEKLIGRSIWKDGKWVHLQSAEEAGVYLGKVVTVRSPTRCTTPGNEICYACLGEMYKGSKNAMNNLAAGFSGELMTLFLKRMHTSGFSTTTIDDVDLFT